ncbi:Protein of unknown function [Bacillus mycoides]|nr:Protein of unknown function [Bacillus mycoides]
MLVIKRWDTEGSCEFKVLYYGGVLACSKIRLVSRS